MDQELLKDRKKIFSKNETLQSILKQDKFITYQKIKISQFIYSNIEVVDIDIYDDVAVEYGIRSVPTLLLMGENNTVIRRITGAKTVSELRTWFTEAPIPV